jgi:hypothetical protein
MPQSAAVRAAHEDDLPLLRREGNPRSHDFNSATLGAKYRKSGVRCSRPNRINHIGIDECSSLLADQGHTALLARADIEPPGEPFNQISNFSGHGWVRRASGHESTHTCSVCPGARPLIMVDCG